MSSFMQQIISVDEVWLAKLYDSVAYEVSILIVFSFSLVLWKTFSSTLLRKPKKVADVGRAQWHSRKDAQTSGNVRPTMTPKALQQTVMEIMTLSQEQYTRALRLYRELVRQGEDGNIRDEAFYFSFVSASIRVGHNDVVHEVLHRAKKHKVELSIQFFQSVLKLLASKQLFSECLLIQKNFGVELPVERTICSCITLSAAEAGQPEVGIRCVERLRASGEEITGKDYQNVFRAYAKSANHVAAQKLLEMLIRTNTPFEAVIMNIVLSTCVVAHHTEVAHALLVKAVKSDGAIPIDVVSYNTVLKGYARQHKLQEAFDLINSMHDTGVSSDEVTYSTILDACIAESCFDKAIEVIDSFIASGFVMNTVIYTTFMKGFVKMDMLEKAMALYRQMRQVGDNPEGPESAKPDVILYSVLIKANCDQRMLEPALQLTKDMIEYGLEPDDMIVNRLLDGCRHISNDETADKIFKEFIESGKIKPTLPTLATMVKIYGKCNRVVDAVRIVATAFEQFQLKPSVVLHTCLMSACARNHRLDLATAALDAMIKDGITPDGMTYSTLFKGCAAAKDWESAVRIARMASNHSGTFPVEEISNFLSQMSGRGDFSFHAEMLQAMLRNHGNKTNSAAESVAPWRKSESTGRKSESTAPWRK
jgi:pentatricopeptide repeat protein